MNKIDYLEKELLRLLDWIKSADARIRLILPLVTAMLGTIAALVPKFELWSVFSGICVSFSVFFLLLSILSVAIASFPRTNGPKGSMIFFSGINNRELRQFKNDVNFFDEEKYQDDLMEQCYINAQIAQIKFVWVKKSMICLFLSSLPWFLSIYSFYGM